MRNIVVCALDYVKRKIFSEKETSTIIPRFENTIFRNDDISFDTNLQHFREFCETFHSFGFIQVHGVTLYGVTNYKYLIDEIPAMYNTIKPGDIYDYEICKSVSKDFIGDNQELIEYLNSIPDEIALHGLYHSDYSQMTYEQQNEDIGEGLRLLHKLFPEKEIRTFIAPFNHTNEDTYKVCQKYGLRVSAEEGDHLEDMIASNRGPILRGQLYRYHHHRFYPESTFTYYDLSTEKLKNYLYENSFTYCESTKKVCPSIGLLSACAKKYDAQSWYIYAYREFELRKHVFLAYKWIRDNIGCESSILEVACGAAGMLFHLQADGFSDLSGYDYDEKAINAANEINQTIQGGINFFIDDATIPTCQNSYDVIIWVNGMYHLDNFSLDDFFDKHVRMLNDNGYLIFDMVDASFNNVPQNEYCTQDWNKTGEKRPSEYRIRMSNVEVVNIAKKYNAILVKEYAVKDIIPRTVYIFKRKKPHICLLCDRPNWAHDYTAQALTKYLSNEFSVDIKYVIDHEKININQFDAFLVFFWGEDSYKQNKYKKEKIIKQVSSHRWQFDPPYGPLSIDMFIDRYLNDAQTVICPSKILFDMLKPFISNLFLCGKGYSPEIFRYVRERSGEMSLCMVGNLKDPVKGVEDILLPAAKGYKLDMEQELKHDELINFYNQHDIYVVASKHEADPLPLIESMACGCFPVASAIGIAPELIRHKENGYIVESRSVEAFQKAFRWCEDNLEYIRKQGKKNADEMYNTRRWSLMAENYRNMLRRHINGNKR